MDENQKKIYLDALKAFDALSDEERLKEFARFENSKICLEHIIDEVQNTDKVQKLYFDDANTPLRDFIKTVVDWSSVYMTAGLAAGYTVKIEKDGK